jgi:hypothetical protein
MIRPGHTGDRFTVTSSERRANGLVFALAIALIHVSVILLTTAGVPDYALLPARRPGPPRPDRLDGVAPGPAGPAQYRHRGSLAAAAAAIAAPAAGGASGLLDDPP